MKISEAFPSRYLKAGDLNGQSASVRMSHLEMEDVAGNGRDEPKPVLYFKGKKKGLVLNVTNARMIAEAYGDDADTWEDEHIELYPTETEFQGKVVPCLRVRVPNPLPPEAGFRTLRTEKPEGESNLGSEPSF